MTDIVSLYQQLESLAEQNHTDIETLITDIRKINIAELEPPESDIYWESVTSAIALITNSFNWDKGGVQQWFEYVDNVFTYDIGLLLSYEDHSASLRYANMKMPHETDELVVGRTWEITLIPMMNHVLETLESTLFEGDDLNQLTIWANVPTMQFCNDDASY